MKPSLAVQLAPRHPRGLLLSVPVMTAAGTFGYGLEYSTVFDIQRLGAIVCKGTTLEPRFGNPQPRLVETAAGVLNSIGLQNIGIEAVVREKAPIWAGWRIPVIVNIAGERVEEYGALASRVEGTPGISGLEVNISCPNIASGGLEFGTTPGAAALVTSRVKANTSLPIVVKLSPNVANIEEIARAVQEAGADAISLVNTFRGMAVDITRRRPVLPNVVGGLSGPAIKPLALHLVYRVAGAVNIPVIGCGGIFSGADALEFMMCGATAVQVGTATLTDPFAPLRVLEEIEQFLEREGIKDIREVVGAARVKSGY